MWYVFIAFKRTRGGAMGIVDSLKKIYFAIEDKYYALADAIEKTGIKIYEWFINPIEERGWPSFPLFLILVALLLGGVYYGATVFLAGQQTATVRVTVLANGMPVDGAQVKLFLKGSDSPLVSTTVNGVVEFQAPNGATATIMIRDSRFKEFSQQIVVGKDGSLVANLESAITQAKKISVMVTNEQGQRLSDSFIQFSESTTGQSGEIFTDASGTGFINFESEDQVFYLTITHSGFESARFTCYASQPSCTAMLLAVTSTPQPKLYGDVRVSVKDEAGNSLESRVVLYEENGLQLSERHTTNGEAFFSEIAEVGTRVYVTVQPDSAQYSTYYGGPNDDLQTVSQASVALFNIRLTRVTGNVDLTKLTIQVVDDSKNPIQGSQISIFQMSKPDKTMDSKSTAATGIAVFDLAFGQMVYATVWASGYLPGVSKSLSGGYATEIKLSKLVPGNYGDALVKVNDADGNPVELAKVWFEDSEGFNVGLPALESGVDGSVSFIGLPLQKSLKAVGVLGSLRGASDLFEAEAGTEKEVSLQLERAFAFVNVSAKDRTKTQNAFVLAEVKAYYNGEEIASCYTRAEDANASCQLKVYANRDVVLKAKAVGFVDFESEAISVPEGETKTQVIIMLPENLKNEIVVTDFRLDSLDDVSQSGVQQVERGGLYKLVMSVNIPDSDKSGIFVRVGDGQNADGDVAWMEAFDQPDARISWGSTFDSAGLCADLQLKQDQNKIKWVQFEYSKGTTGIKTFGAVLKISNIAKNSDKLNIYHRAFFMRNGFWVYNPEDADLGNAESTGAKENCFAQTERTSFDVTEGRGKCTDLACLAVSFAAGDVSVANGLEVPINSQFNVIAEVRSFSTVSNPYVKITTVADSGISLEQTRKQLDFSQSNKDSFTTTGSALLPTDYAPVRVEYGDENGPMISLERFVAVKGTARMLVLAKPSEIQALQQSTITVTVTTEAGTPIKDANVLIEDSPVFANNPNGDYAIAGDGTQDRGAGGIYKFRNLLPVAPGVFYFKVSRKDFADGRAAVRVTAVEFLQADVPEISLGGTMTECNDGFVTISNFIEAEVLVKASVSFPGCVSLDNQGAEESFSLKAASKPENSKRVRLTPVANGNCVVSFNSVLNASGSASTAEVLARVDCPKLRPIEPPPSACSSNNCVACSENECLDLFDRTDANGQPVHYCRPDYEIVPGGTRFKQCKQGDVVGPPVTPSVTPPPSNQTQFGSQFECGSSQCLACNENQCKSLQSAGYCMPFYNRPVPNEMNITDIGGGRFEPSFLPVQSNAFFTFRNTGIKQHTIIFDNNVYPPIKLAPQETRSINLNELNPPALLYYFHDSETLSAVGAVQVQTASSTGFSYCGKFEQLNETQINLCSENNCAACTEAQCLNLPNNCEPAYTGSGYAEKLVSVTDAGFNPQVITAKPNEAVRWRNDGVLQHQIVFDNHPELDTGVFTAGQTKQLQISQEGDYTYKCALHTSSVGRVIVSSASSSTGRNFVACVPKGAAGANNTFTPGGVPSGNQTGVPGANQTAPGAECDPAKFDFSQMLARRLGQYHANQLFNPNSAGRTAAASASNRLILSSYGWQVERVGAGCQQIGQSAVRCEKPVNALFPRNGMSFSVQNKLGIDTTIDVGFMQGSQSCFKITNAEQRTGFDQFVTGLRDFAIGALGLPQNQYRTYVLIYDATKPGCAEWTADATNGLHLNPTGGSAVIRIGSMALLGGSATQFRIEFQAIAGDDSAFAPLAFIASPSTSVSYRVAEGTSGQQSPSPSASPSQAPSPSPTVVIVGGGGGQQGTGGTGGVSETPYLTSTVEEPFVFANNLPVAVAINKPFSLQLSATSNASTSGVKLQKSKIPSSLELTIGQAKAYYDIADPIVVSVLAQLAKFDIVGNPGVDGGTLRCSGTAYCNDDEAANAILELQQSLSGAFANMYSQMDTVQFTGFVDGSADVFRKALDDASRDYEAALQTYLACKALGQDPIAELEARCARLQNTPLGSEDWGAVYGDAFAQTACDSELFAYGRGMYGGYGNQQFWDSYKQRLLMRMQPVSGNMGYGKPIIPPESINIKVPIKIAGADGGTFLASFKVNPAMQATTSDSYWNDFGGDFEWQHLTTIEGSVGPFPILSDLLSRLKRGYSSANNELTITRLAPFFYVQEGVANAVQTSTSGYYNAPTLFTLNKYPIGVYDANGKGQAVFTTLNNLPVYVSSPDSPDKNKIITVYACALDAGNLTAANCGFPSNSFTKPSGTFATFQLTGSNMVIATDIMPQADGSGNSQPMIDEVLKTLFDETHSFEANSLNGCAFSEVVLNKITITCSAQLNAMPPGGGTLTVSPSPSPPGGGIPPFTPPSGTWTAPPNDLTTLLGANAPYKILVPVLNYPSSMSISDPQSWYFTYRVGNNAGQIAEDVTDNTAKFTKMTLELYAGGTDSSSPIRASACRQESPDYNNPEKCRYKITPPDDRLLRGNSDYLLGYHIDFSMVQHDQTAEITNDDLSSFGITVVKEGSQLKFSNGTNSIYVDANTPLWVKVYGKWENAVTAANSPTHQAIPAGSYVWGKGRYTVGGSSAGGGTGDITAVTPQNFIRTLDLYFAVPSQPELDVYFMARFTDKPFPEDMSSICLKAYAGGSLIAQSSPSRAFGLAHPLGGIVSLLTDDGLTELCNNPSSLVSVDLYKNPSGTIWVGDCLGGELVETYHQQPASGTEGYADVCSSFSPTPSASPTPTPTSTTAQPCTITSAELVGSQSVRVSFTPPQQAYEIDVSMHSPDGQFLASETRSNMPSPVVIPFLPSPQNVVGGGYVAITVVCRHGGVVGDVDTARVYFTSFPFPTVTP